LKVIEDVKNIKKELLLTKTDCALSEKVWGYYLNEWLIFS
jgi:hypothetical protein